MVRKNLSEMLAARTEEEAPDTKQTSKLPQYRTLEVRKSNPRYTAFLPKTARLREDQITSLHALATRLQASRSSTEERITDNTLLRIAVDLLMERGNELAGSTELELRASIGLPPA